MAKTRQFWLVTFTADGGLTTAGPLDEADAAVELDKLGSAVALVFDRAPLTYRRTILIGAAEIAPTPRATRSDKGKPRGRRAAAPAPVPAPDPILATWVKELTLCRRLTSVADCLADARRVLFDDPERLAKVEDLAAARHAALT